MWDFLNILLDPRHKLDIAAIAYRLRPMTRRPARGLIISYRSLSMILPLSLYPLERLVSLSFFFFFFYGFLSVFLKLVPQLPKIQSIKCLDRTTCEGQ